MILINRSFARAALVLLAATLLFTTLLMPTPASAQVDTFAFDTAEQQARFRHLSDIFRCPMCQNTSLSGSTGGTAEDLRREIHDMIMDGWTDEQIKQFMFDRYGDFIFYQPRLRAETILLWFGPLLFLLIGGLVAFSVWRRAKSFDDGSAELDDDQQTRLRKLLDDTSSTSSTSNNSQ